MYRKGVSLVLIALTIALAVFYVYSIARTVSNGIALNDINKEIVSVKRSISELDQAFLAKEKAVTIDLAHSKGFIATDVSLFIDRDASQGLSFNNER
jgi:cell division protein FtsL